MPELVPCPGCDQLFVAGACACPHCGASTCGGPSRGLRRNLATLGVALTLTGCIGQGQAAYGVPIADSAWSPQDSQALTDADDDGYFAEEDDCDDEDPAVNPGAVETPGDKLDSNCNGDDDT